MSAAMYTPELGAMFCAAMAVTSDSIATICARDGMPSKATIFRWKLDIPEFAAMYAAAKSDQVDAQFDEIIEIADGVAPTSEAVAKAKLRIYARIEVAQRLKPKAYGNKVTSEVTGPDGGPVQFEKIERVVIRPANPNA